MTAKKPVHIWICSDYGEQLPPGDDVPKGWVSCPLPWNGQDGGMVVAYDPRQVSVIAVGGTEAALTDRNRWDIERLGYQRWFWDEHGAELWVAETRDLHRRLDRLPGPSSQIDVRGVGLA